MQVIPVDERYQTLKLTIVVRDRAHLAHVMRRVRRNKFVVKLYRDSNK